MVCAIFGTLHVNYVNVCVNCSVYIIIALFVLAASLALHECVTALFHLLPISDRYK